MSKLSAAMETRNRTLLATLSMSIQSAKVVMQAHTAVVMLLS
jgi:hypothetical protein